MSRLSGLVATSRARQEFVDIDLADGGEVAIPTAHRSERVRLLQAHDDVGVYPQVVDHIGRSDRRRHGDTGGTSCTSDRDGGTDRGAGGDAVVDDDNEATLDVDARADGANRAEQSVEVASFTLLDFGELLVVDPRRPDHVVVDHSHAVLADRSHRQLGLSWHSDLADHDDVERCVDHRSDFCSDGNATAREPEHHRIFQFQPGDFDGEARARSSTIAKDGPGHSPTMRAATTGLLAGLASPITNAARTASAAAAASD